MLARVSASPPAFEEKGKQAILRIAPKIKRTVDVRETSPGDGPAAPLDGLNFNSWEELFTPRFLGEKIF